MRFGIDLGGTKIEIIALEADGRALLRRRVATPQNDYTATVEAIKNLVGNAERQVGQCSRIGIATPGAVSPATGLLKNSNSTCLNGKPLLEDLQHALRRPVRIANDADCLALSEATDGAGAEFETVFAVILGTGVGAGIVCRGHLIQGPNAIAGEWGHNPLPWPDDHERPGFACYCGRRGCIETFLSGAGLSRGYDEDQTVDARAIVEKAIQGESRALDALHAYQHRLARALAHVINLLDPHVIVLAGGLSNIESLYATVPRLWSEFVFSDRVDTQLKRAEHGDSSGVRGAACLWPDS